MQKDDPRSGGILFISDAEVVAEHKDAAGGAAHGEGQSRTEVVGSHRLKARCDLVPDVTRF